MHFLAHFELSSSHIELIGPGKKKTRRYINQSKKLKEERRKEKERKKEKQD